MSVYRLDSNPSSGRTSCYSKRRRHRDCLETRRRWTQTGSRGCLGTEWWCPDQLHN